MDWNDIRRQRKEQEEAWVVLWGMVSCFQKRITAALEKLTANEGRVRFDIFTHAKAVLAESTERCLIIERSILRYMAKFNIPGIIETPDPSPERILEIKEGLRRGDCDDIMADRRHKEEAEKELREMTRRLDEYEKEHLKDPLGADKAFLAGYILVGSQFRLETYQEKLPRFDDMLSSFEMAISALLNGEEDVH